MAHPLGEAEAIARHSVNALIEDAKSDFAGKQGESFAWAVFNAVRYSDATHLDNLRDLLRKRGVNIEPDEPPFSSWVN